MVIYTHKKSIGLLQILSSLFLQIEIFPFCNQVSKFCRSVKRYFYVFFSFYIFLRKEKLINGTIGSITER